MFVYTRNKINDLQYIEFEHNTETDVDNFYLHQKEVDSDGLTYTVGSSHIFQLTENGSKRFDNCTDALECICTFMLMRFYAMF